MSSDVGALMSVSGGSGGGGGSGTVTSVGLALPDIFDVTGSPVTTSGTLTATLADEAANKVLAGPTSGGPGTPAFRALVAADIPEPTGVANAFAGFDNAGVLESVPGFTIDTTSGGMNITLIERPNNSGGGLTVNSEAYNFDPLQNSPNENYNIYNMGVNFDINNSGFDQGTVGNAVQLLNLGFNHIGTGSIGGVVYENFTGSFGNGTDPISVNGMTLIGTGIQFHANVTIVGQLQGYSFDPSVDAAAIAGPSFSAQAYSDSANIQIPINSYFSANLAPNLVEITNNSNYVGANVNPNIATLTGNANAQGFSFNGIFGTTGTGGVTGASFNPSITTMGASSRYHGLDVLGNIATSHGNVQGISINTNINGGDAAFTGISVNPGGTATLPQVQGINVNMSGIASTAMKAGVTIQDGALTSSCTYDTSVLPASPGFQQLNSIGGLFHVAAGNPTTNTAVFANYLGVNAEFEDDMGPDAFGGFLGFVQESMLGQVLVATGKTVDTYTAAAIGASVPADAVTGGSITNANNLTLAGLVNAGGTVAVTNLKGVNILSTFNAFTASNAWGIYVADTSVDNWFAKNVVVGGATGKPVGSEALSVTGSSYLNGALDMVTHQIHNVVDPSSAQDAATKNYVDTLAPTVSAIPSTVIDWSLLGSAGGIYTKTLSASPTFTFSNVAAGQTIVVRLTNTVSNYTVTWPTVKWSGGTPPVMSPGAVDDVYTFISDGTSIYGSAVQNLF